ncbi:MAG: hypothetical protein Q9179_003141 [Wetmoreana sp. 5 TL-2023]
MPHDGLAVDTQSNIRRDDTANYVVYPKDSTNKDQVETINNLLKGLVSKETKIYASETVIRTLFFAAPLTSENARKVEADPNVAAVVQECTTNCPDPVEEAGRQTNSTEYDIFFQGVTSRLAKRDDGLVNSHNADPEMVYVSLPDGDSVGDYHDFVYDRSAGTGVNVYIVDTGAGLTNNDEFARFVIPNSRWIHAAGAHVFAPQWKHGIAKRSNPIIVRVPVLGDPAAWADGVRRPKTATAILNLSWGFSRAKLAAAGYNNQQQDAWIAGLRDALNDCVSIGLLVSA